jgi:hypothetical protein
MLLKVTTGTTVSNSLEENKRLKDKKSLLFVRNNACRESRPIIATPSHKHHSANTNSIIQF